MPEQVVLDRLLEIFGMGFQVIPVLGPGFGQIVIIKKAWSGFQESLKKEQAIALKNMGSGD